MQNKFAFVLLLVWSFPLWAFVEPTGAYNFVQLTSPILKRQCPSRLLAKGKHFRQYETSVKKYYGLADGTNTLCGPVCVVNAIIRRWKLKNKPLEILNVLVDQIARGTTLDVWQIALTRGTVFSQLERTLRQYAADNGITPKIEDFGMYDEGERKDITIERLKQLTKSSTVIALIKWGRFGKKIQGEYYYPGERRLQRIDAEQFSQDFSFRENFGHFVLIDSIRTKTPTRQQIAITDPRVAQRFLLTTTQTKTRYGYQSLRIIDPSYEPKIAINGPKKRPTFQLRGFGFVISGLMAIR